MKSYKGIGCQRSHNQDDNNNADRYQQRICHGMDDLHHGFRIVCKMPFGRQRKGFLYDLLAPLE